MIDIRLQPNSIAFEGTLLLLIALAALLFMFPLKHKARSSWFITLFFACMALLGISRVIEGTIGGELYIMLQDTCITMGGLFLVQFAYTFPRHDQPTEARIAFFTYCFLVLLSFGTIVPPENSIVLNLLPIFHTG